MLRNCSLLLFRGKTSGQCGPCRPGCTIEKADEPDLADDPPRQQHDLERILQSKGKQEHRENSDDNRDHAWENTAEPVAVPCPSSEPPNKPEHVRTCRQLSRILGMFIRLRPSRLVRISCPVGSKIMR
jgi:hypothetical protein